VVTFATLQNVQPSKFEQAADGYHAVSSAAGEGKDRLANQILAKTFPSARSGDSSGEGLTGEAASAARRRLDRLEKSLHYTQVECGLISAMLNGFASELRAAKKKLTTAVEEAESAGLAVEQDGSVTYPAAGKKDGGVTPKGGTAQGHTDETARGVADQAAGFDPNPNCARAQDLANRIANAVKEATEVDQQWAPKIRRLNAQNDLTVTSKDWANVYGDQRAARIVAGAYLDVGDLPEGKSAEENASWWAELSAQEKADYVSLYPASVGALNGLPAEVRDVANRAVLAEKRGQYQSELDAIPPRPGLYAHPGASRGTDWREQQQKIKEWEEDHGAKHEHLTAVLDGMGAIEDRFARTGQEGLPEAYLLGFDPDGAGDGKVILANGNPDTASRVATYVPGTFSGIESIGSGDDHGDLGRGERLWQQSHRMSPQETISTITWLDYNAPDSIAPEATAGAAADRGGDTLREFMEGNRVAHEHASGGSAHTTVIGHSYGSTVVGEAAQSVNYADDSWRHTPLADEIVLVGSPGVQADHASDLGVADGHVWAMGAGGDDQVVRQGGRIVGLGDNGTVPTDPWFGANVMKNDSANHTGFWEDDSRSLRNQAAVITARRDRITLE
jgi:hypothetical protein